MIKITIDTENDSFGFTENQKAFEVVAVLKKLIINIQRHGDIRDQKVFDTNGNCVGHLEK